jgi:hypothetical protein
VATFNFSESDGTQLGSIDANWLGNVTLLNANSGFCQVTATGGGTLRMARYSNGHGAIQSSQALVKAFANTARRSMHTQMSSTTITTGGGYEARLAGTNTVELRRNNSYVTEGSISGGNHTTTDYVIKIRSNASTGQVEVWWAASGAADAEATGTRIINNTDGSPISGGFPGFSLASPTNVTDARIDDWTDFESGEATLSSETPSGTIGTATTATLGATTDQASGTFYAVVDEEANITGISAAQVKAGQNNASAAPVASGNASVSTTSPSVGVTGLTAATAYSFAVVQNNSNGDSNVLTGSFTTAVAANPQARIYGPQGFVSTLLTM